MKKTLLLAALAAPSALSAQGRTVVSPYISADGSVRGSPVLVGASVQREHGWIATRVGGMVDAHSTPVGSWMGDGAGVKVFGLDGDGLLFMGSPTRDGVVPYALVGVGGRLLNDADGTVGSASWSYGAGVRSPLASWASLEGEVRHREPVSFRALPSVVSAGWEFRFGASVRVRGGSMRDRGVAPAPVIRRREASATPAMTVATTTAASKRALVSRALDVADDYLGTPYVWGGNTPEQGFDCSGFVRYVFAKEGIELPRVSRDQARVGEQVPTDERFLEPADLIAFASDGTHVDHIAIYVGGGRFIHSSSSGNGVRFDDLHTERGHWYLTHMVAARRIIVAPPTYTADTGSLPASPGSGGR